MGMGQKDSVRARAVELGRLKDCYEALRRAARAPQRRRFFAAALDLVLIVCLPRMIAAIVVLILAALRPFILGFALSTLFQELEFVGLRLGGDREPHLPGPRVRNEGPAEP